jgi:hypothetical protein
VSLQALFYLVAIAGLLYVVLKKRRFDFLAIGFLSAIVYFMPGFFGSVLFPDTPWSLTPDPIIPATYVVYVMVMAAILLAAILHDLFPESKPRHWVLRGSRDTCVLALFLGLTGLGMCVATTGAALLSTDKTEMLAALNRWIILWEGGASIAAVTAFSRKRWSVFTLSLLLIAGDVYIGNRVVAAITTMTLFTLVLSSQRPSRLAVRQFVVGALGFGAAAFFFVYKYLYIYVKEKDWAAIGASLKNPGFYLLSIRGSEPFITQTILNEVLRTGFTVPMEHFKTSLNQFMFLAGSLGADIRSYNDYFQLTLFPNSYNYGMANNIWAEMWSSGGWPLLTLFIVLFALSLCFGSWVLKIPNPELRSIGAMLFMYWAFYLHRNDLNVHLNIEKRLVVLSLIALLGSMIYHDVSRRVRRAREIPPDPQTPPPLDPAVAPGSRAL